MTGTAADPGFQVRGGGALKKNCTERREARTFLGYFVWKITILRQKMIFFPILGCTPPWIRLCGRIKLVVRTQTLPLIFSLYNRNTTKWSEHEAFIQHRSVDILFSRSIYVKDNLQKFLIRNSLLCVVVDGGLLQAQFPAISNIPPFNLWQLKHPYIGALHILLILILFVNLFS